MSMIVMADKYLEKLQNIQKKEQERNYNAEKEKQRYAERQKYESFKAGYKRITDKDADMFYKTSVKENTLDSFGSLKFKRERNKILTKEGNNPWSELDAHNKGAYLSLANKLMSSPIIGEVIQGAKIYEGLGVGNRASVKRRLLKAYTKRPEKYYEKEIASFLKRNPESKQSGKTLEHKFISVIAGASIIAALFFLFPNLTGNVVGNLVKSDSNLIGAVLFSLGIIGLFISFRRK